MRRIALINQKGGVGKTTTTANLGAALAREGRRVVLVDLDPQANLSLHLDAQPKSDEPSTYTVLLGNGSFGSALRATSTPGMRLVPSNIDLSGAELELASALGRETLLRDAVDAWESAERQAGGRAPADYVLFDCPPSLGLLSVNGLVAAGEAIVTVQTEFFALQGMSKLVDVIALLRRRLNPTLAITGILPCLYDSRLKLAREVLAEIRAYFPGQVFERAIAKNVKLAEAPSYGQTIFEYAPECSGASDYRMVALELIAQEAADPDLAALPRPAARAAVSADPLPAASAPPSAEPAARFPVDHGSERSAEGVGDRLAEPRDPGLREIVLTPAEPVRAPAGPPPAVQESQAAHSALGEPGLQSANGHTRAALAPSSEAPECASAIWSGAPSALAVLEQAPPEALSAEELPELPEDAVEIPASEW